VQLAGCRIEQVRLLASVDLKADEAGLLEAARTLGLPLRIISSDEIRNTAHHFKHSDFVQSKVRLPAVAEPAALLAGRRTQLLLPKTIIQGVTIAVAQEDCLS
jgi:cobalt-precorrin 5A hydrolase